MKKGLSALFVIISLFLFSCESDFNTDRLDDFRPMLEEYDRIVSQQTVCDIAIVAVEAQIRNAEANGESESLPELNANLAKLNKARTELSADSERLDILGKYSELDKDIEEYGRLTKDIATKSVVMAQYPKLIRDAKDNNNLELVERLTSELIATNKEIGGLTKDKAEVKAYLKGKVEKGNY